MDRTEAAVVIKVAAATAAVVSATMAFVAIVGWVAAVLTAAIIIAASLLAAGRAARLSESADPVLPIESPAEPDRDPLL